MTGSSDCGGRRFGRCPATEGGTRCSCRSMGLDSPCRLRPSRDARAWRSAVEASATTSPRATAWRSWPPSPRRGPRAVRGPSTRTLGAARAAPRPRLLQEPAAREARAGLRRVLRGLCDVRRPRMGTRSPPAPRPARRSPGPRAGHGPRRPQRPRRRHRRGLSPRGHLSRTRAQRRPGRARRRPARRRRPPPPDLAPAPRDRRVLRARGLRPPRGRRRAGVPGRGDGYRAGPGPRARPRRRPRQPARGRGLLLLAANPAAIGDVGFQFSFLATLAIVLIAPRAQPSLAACPSGWAARWRRPWRRRRPCSRCWPTTSIASRRPPSA